MSSLSSFWIFSGAGVGVAEGMEIGSETDEEEERLREGVIASESFGVRGVTITEKQVKENE